MRSASPERLTLMVIDNDPQFRRGLVSRLAQDPAISVALEADSETSALRVLQHWLSPASSDRPEPIQLDVILLSLDLPFGEDRAIALARQLQQLPRSADSAHGAHPHPRHPCRRFPSRTPGILSQGQCRQRVDDHDSASRRRV